MATERDRAMTMLMLGSMAKDQWKKQGSRIPQDRVEDIQKWATLGRAVMRKLSEEVADGQPPSIETFKLANSVSQGLASLIDELHYELIISGKLSEYVIQSMRDGLKNSAENLKNYYDEQSPRSKR